MNRIAEAADAVFADLAAERAARAPVPPAAAPVIGTMTEEEMFRRCVLVKQKGSPVVVLPAPGESRRAIVLDMNTFVEVHRASRRTVTEDGRTSSRALTAVWRDSSDRLAVESIVVALGSPRFTLDHNKRPAVNLWTPRARVEPERWEDRIQIFLDHIAFLVPAAEERELFLDWLAHAEQHPEVLPHYGFLFVTKAFGTGRNWVSSVLDRVWPGEVASSLDLHGMLASGFNGAIGGGIRCAVADEVRIGGSVSAAYELEQRWRQMLTAEYHLINPKYGHQFREKNCVRWLLLSNHEDALRLSREDRRVAVVANPAQPRAADYYVTLYNALSDAAFVDSVAWFLHARDIHHFKPGDRPPLNAAKLAVVEATMSELDKELTDLLEEWKAPVAASADLMKLLGIDGKDQSRKKHLSLALRRAGWHSLFGSRKVRVARGERAYVWARGEYVIECPEAAAAAVREYRGAPWFGELSHEPF